MHWVTYLCIGRWKYENYVRSTNHAKVHVAVARVLEPEPPGAGVFGCWSRSRLLWPGSGFGSSLLSSIQACYYYYYYYYYYY